MSSARRAPLPAQYCLERRASSSNTMSGKQMTELENCLAAKFAALQCSKWGSTPPEKLYALSLVRPQILCNARRYRTTDGNILAIIGLRVSSLASWERQVLHKSVVIHLSECLLLQVLQGTHLQLNDSSTGEQVDVMDTAAAPPRRWWPPHPLASGSCQTNRRAGAAARVGRLAAHLPGLAVHPVGWITRQLIQP